MAKKRHRRPVGLYLLLTASLVLVAGLWLLAIGRPTAPDLQPAASKTSAVTHRSVPKPATKTATAPAAKPVKSAVPPPVPVAPIKPLIAIIIDDIGYQLESGLRCIELPGAVTLAVLPFSPHSQRLAKLALANGKELMLHAPMEPGAQVRWEGGLTNAMDRGDVHQALAAMLQQVPGVRGVNNHMGSEFTQNRQSMDWVMEALQQQKLYFVDSRTSASSEAYNAALSRALPSAKRDVFLDNNRSHAAIAQQFQTLVDKARRNGFAIGIGHPYPETVEVLEQILPKLDQYGVQLVPVSQLLSQVQDTSKPWALWASRNKPTPSQ